MLLEQAKLLIQIERGWGRGGGVNWFLEVDIPVLSHKICVSIKLSELGIVTISFNIATTRQRITL